MDENKLKLYIAKAKAAYYEIGYVYSLAFGENVYFNARGFIHLLRKGKSPRPRSEQLRRLRLIFAAVKVIQTEKSVSSYEIIKRNGISAHFWVLRSLLGSVRIRVVIRKIDNGKIHFFSVMNK